eukprot:3843883-Amphidinium_carterae.1
MAESRKLLLWKLMMPDFQPPSFTAPLITKSNDSNHYRICQAFSGGAGVGRAFGSSGKFKSPSADHASDSCAPLPGTSPVNTKQREEM